MKIVREKIRLVLNFTQVMMRLFGLLVREEKVEFISVRGELLIQTPPDKR
jgi:hypothetical protein